MNTKFVVQVLLTITVLLVMLLTVHYNYYWDLNPVILKTKSYIRSNNFIPSIKKVLTTQGLRCGEKSYTKQERAQLKSYWKLLNDYRQFHMDGVRKLNSGKSSDVRTMTWHCSDAYLCGGLGYRLLGITVNLLFAIFTNRVLLLKWDRSSVENTYLLPNMIDWRYPNDSLEGTFKDLGSFHSVKSKIFEMEMIKFLTGDTMHVQMLYNSVHVAVDEIIPKIKNAEFGNFNVKQNHIHSLYTLSFVYLFRTSKELQSFVNITHNKLNLHGQRYVALHIRTGEIDPDIVKQRFTNESDRFASYAQCAIKQADKHIGPDSVVVVVSDSASVKQKLAKKYSRVKFLDNSIVHVDKAEELDSDAMLGTWQDIIIMAEAHILVYHRSAFPEVSIALCGIPSKRVVTNINACTATLLDVTI